MRWTGRHLKNDTQINVGLWQHLIVSIFAPDLLVTIVRRSFSAERPEKFRCKRWCQEFREQGRHLHFPASLLNQHPAMSETKTAKQRPANSKPVTSTDGSCSAPPHGSDDTTHNVRAHAQKTGTVTTLGISWVPLGE